MKHKLGVLLIHGIGNQKENYADEMIGELRRRIRALGGDDREICFQPVWWAPVLAKRQRELLERLAGANRLRWMGLRRFVMNSLADAIAYQDTYRPTSPGQVNVYRQVHQEIAAEMADLRNRLRDGAAPGAPEAPLVVISHSLGCHMVTNYIWDVRHPKDPSQQPPTAFERFDSLTGMITFGCNIPVFTLAYTNLEPIDFPTPDVARFFPPGTDPGAIARVQKWLNFYDPDDALGYPLRAVDPAYASTVSADIPVNVGGLLRFWNPASHTAYWKDSSVTKPVADLLHGILRLL